MNNSNKIIDFITKNKFIILLILLVLVVSIVLISALSNKETRPDITYNEIKELIDNKETFLIYYYNSRSNNKYNKEIKKLLDKNEINYYIYDDNNVDKEEYNNFLTLIGIDKNLFGTPAIIYIKDGNMYSNLISINNEDSFNTYIKDYDLVTIK